MRTIKFRAWDKTEGKYRRFDGRHDTMMISRDGSIRYYNLQNGSGGNEYILEQFTGLKDKNGVEIYEGDLLHNPNDREPFYEIVWDKKHAGFSLGHDSSLALGQYVFHDFWEVIGNIHENPELLEATT